VVAAAAQHLRRVELRVDPEDALGEVARGEVPRDEVDLLPGVVVPVAVRDEASLAAQPLVGAGAGKRREHGEVGLVHPRVDDEVARAGEDVLAVAVEAEDEQAHHGDAARLDAPHDVGILLDARRLPRRLEREALLDRRFEADERLDAAGLAHQVEEFGVVGDGDVGVGLPLHLERDHLAQQGLDEAPVHGSSRRRR
jgi:hypothetical protein